MTLISKSLKLKSFFNLAPALLVTLPLIANLFSRNTAEYFFDLLILVTFYWSSKKKHGFTWNNLRIKSFFDILWPLFIATIVLGYILNGTLGTPQLGELVKFMWILGFYCLVRMLKAVSFPKWAYSAICVFLIVTGAALTIHFFTFPPYNVNDWGLPNRLQGTFTNTNFLAHSYYIIFLFLIAQFFSHLHSNRTQALLPLVAAITFGIVLILTFNRSIWLTSFVILPLLGFSWNRKLAFKLLAFFVAIGATLYLSDFGGFRYRAEGTLTPTQSGDLTRINLWKTNFHIFLQNPIFGVGYYNNTRDINKYYSELGITEGNLESHAHNEFLSFLAGTGIVGTVLYISFFIYFGLLAWRTIFYIKNSMPIRRGLIVGAFVVQPAFLVLGIADNNFEIHVARNFLIVSWALILYLYSEFNPNSVHPNDYAQAKKF